MEVGLLIFFKINYKNNLDSFLIITRTYIKTLREFMEQLPANLFEKNSAICTQAT